MEKYFRVTEQCGLYKAWFSYKENAQRVQELFKQFKNQVGIDSAQYFVSNNEIYIVPTEKDNEAFANVLCAPINEGLRKFRSSSKIAKAWVTALKETKLTVLDKPMVILYFRSFGGQYQSRLFDRNGAVYCSISPVVGEEVPEGFVEMKASEFFRIIEESEKDSA